jgi:hypothetical protein
VAASRLLLAIVALGGSGRSAADGVWYNQPRVSVGAIYNDNISLSPTEARSSFGAQALAAIRAGYRSPTTDMGINAAVGGTAYFDSSSDDSTSVSLALDAAHQWERNRLGLGVTFSYLPTTASEVGTTGDFQEDNTQLRYSLSPSWSHQLTERLNFELLASYSDALYQNSSEGLSDYRSLGGWLLGSYSLTEVTQLTGRLSFDRYESQGSTNESDSIGLSAGVRHEFSETFRGLAELGARSTESTTAGLFGEDVDSSSTGPLANLQLDWQRETGSWSAQIGRWLTPSGDGLLDTTRVSVGGSQSLSERMAMQFGVQAFRNRGDVGANTTRRNRDRDYADASIGFSYQLAPDWQLQGTYRFAWQKYEDDKVDEGAGTGNSVFLNVSYTWPRELPGLYSEAR